MFTVQCSIVISIRRKRDSNPRYGSPYSGFQDRRFQPLTHSSDVELTLTRQGIPGTESTSHSFHAQGNAHPAADTQCCEPVPGFSLLHFIYERRDDAGSGAADRVT